MTSKKKKKKSHLLIFIISLLFLSIFPFSMPLSSLSSFSLSLPFFLLSHSFQNFPQTFQGWATRPPRPPLVTPLLRSHPFTKHHQRSTLKTIFMYSYINFHPLIFSTFAHSSVFVNGILGLKKIIVWLSSTTFFEKGRVGRFFFFF